MRNDVFYHAQAAYRLGDCKRGKFIFVLADRTGIEREAQTIEAYLTRIAAEYADSLTNIFDTPVVRFVASGRYDVTARWKDGHITLQATSSGTDYTRHGKMARNREVRVDDCKSFVDALRKASNRSRLVCKAIGADMMTYASLLELFAKRPEGSSWFEFSPSADVWPNTADTQSEDVEPAAVETETVAVEPVEVEHDGVVDVELAETSETIPVVEAETRSVESAPQLPAECSAETQEIPEVPPQTNEDAQAVAESEPAGPRAALYRSTCDSAGNDYTMVVDGRGMSTREAASFVADYIRNNIRPNFRNVGMESAFCVTVDARVRVTAKICGVGGVRAEVEYYRLNAEVSYRCFSVWAESADYFGKAIRDRGVTDAWDKTISFARGIEVALKRDKLIHKHDGNECAARVETYGEAIGYKDASTYDERVVSLPVGGFIEPGASDVPGVPSETVTAVPAEPRTVESAPVLPAGCDAVTQEIPEVPPQTNEDARVLQVSEHVIPACVTLKEYELTRNVPRKRRREFRDSRGRKCAYVVRADDGAFILWRSWYKHEDAEMDAAVRAYYAQVA